MSLIDAAAPPRTADPRSSRPVAARALVALVAGSQGERHPAHAEQQQHAVEGGQARLHQDRVVEHQQPRAERGDPAAARELAHQEVQHDDQQRTGQGRQDPQDHGRVRAGSADVGAAEPGPGAEDQLAQWWVQVEVVATVLVPQGVLAEVDLVEDDCARSQEEGEARQGRQDGQHVELDRHPCEDTSPARAWPVGGVGVRLGGGRLGARGGCDRCHGRDTSEENEPST